MKLKDTLKRVDELSAELNRLRPIFPAQEKRIMDKFRLDWNYNSNHLEGNRLSFGETKALLLHGITAQGKPLKDHLEIKGHNEALKYIEEVIKKVRPFTETFIREVHEMILKETYEVDAITPDGQPTRRQIHIGEYKTVPNHVLTKTGEIFYFATPEETPAKMADLVAWVKSELDNEEASPLLLAAEFHYKFICIHPFDDGNGRLARILMNFILMVKGLPPVIIKADKKDEYFGALQQADGGNLEFFFEYIGEQLIHSLEIMVKGAKGESIEELDDVDKELALLKQELRNEEDVRFRKSNEVILKLWQNSFFQLFDSIHKKMNQFDDLFLEKSERCAVNENGSISEGHDDDYNSYINTQFDRIIQLINAKEREVDPNNINRIVRELDAFKIDSIGYRCRWEGFKKNRHNPFDLEVGIEIHFNKMKYSVNGLGNTKDAFEPISKLYHEILSDAEIEKIANALAKYVLAGIKRNLDMAAE